MSDGIPNSRDCFACGIDNPRGLSLKFQRENGRVFADVTIPEWAVGYRDTAHGGIVATLLDEAMSWAATCYAKKPATTGEMTIRFRQPTPLGKSLRLEAEVTRGRGALLLVEARLLDPDGLLYANAAGKYMKLPETARDTFELVYGPEDYRVFEDTEG